MRRLFHVRGSGNFPFYMLSFDRCFPATVEEAEKITLACPIQAPVQTIVLASDMSTSPTQTLWREKKWPVVRIE